MLHKDLRVRGEDAIQWGADHLTKCHTKDDELYVMFGDPHYWGHPEAIMTSRTALHISQSKPGAEVAAEAAAALAASAMILSPNLRDTRDSYVRHARQLYEFAYKYRVKYHDSVPEAANFYKSWSGYQDELVWAAIWLYRLTNEETYLKNAEALYNDFKLQTQDIDEFSWDNKLLGLKMLLYKLTLDEKYKNAPKEHCDKLINGYKETPKGMYYFGSEIGSIKYALASAFICLSFGETLVDINQLANNPYQDFALRQLHYALGGTGRSYVVGYGTNYPRFPYHRGASCLPYPADCTWDAVNSESPNPTEILGALVGGPDQNDTYQDIRDWKQNGVTVYQNAALQSLLAAVMSLLEKGKLSLETVHFGLPDFI
ncbi:hypothetical protein B566_EDAN010475 [Ephemera danica]|nr:hypothetical protein B566_EDAN010475 [Ephemera danica]